LTSIDPALEHVLRQRNPPILRPILNASRYLVLAAVIGALAGSLALFVYGLAETFVVIAQAIAKVRTVCRSARSMT
jgi:uncharacterized membrane protein YqhA